MTPGSITSRIYRQQWDPSQLDTVLPASWVKAVQEKYQLDKGREKLFFAPWLDHQLYYLLEPPHHVSGRDIAERTADPLNQVLTGLPALSHTTMATYLNDLPPKALMELVKKVNALAKTLAKAKGINVRSHVGVDASVLQATKRTWKWAANNGKRNVLQVHLQTHFNHGIIGHFAFDFKTTSSNTCFEDMLNYLPAGCLLSLDRGYTCVELLIKLVKSGRHWISKFYNSYTWTPVEQKPLPPDRMTRRGKEVIRDAIGWFGHPHQGGPILTRKITVKSPTKRRKNKLVVYHTSDLAGDPVELVDFMSDHWALENLFRSLKRVWQLTAIISHKLEGVLNYILLHLLLLGLLSLYALLSQRLSILTNFRSLVRAWRRSLHQGLLSTLTGSYNLS